MGNECIKCGSKYKCSSLKLDNGYCLQCKPDFFSVPFFLHCSSQGTLKLWKNNLGLHFIMLIFFSLLPDGGYISFPGAVYCLIIMAYFVGRIAIGKIKGFPVLSKMQMYLLLFLPIYGSVSFVFYFHFIQSLKY